MAFRVSGPGPMGPMAWSLNLQLFGRLSFEHGACSMRSPETLALDADRIPSR